MYTMNEHYFDEIDSSDKAYWLGFSWCDGYVNKRQKKSTHKPTYEFKLGLSEVDEDHLELFTTYLCSNHIIRKNDIKSGYETDKQEARLLITKNHFGKILYDKYGMIPRRTDIEPLISNVPVEYYPDLIRGVVDADGSIIQRDIQFKKNSRKEFSFGLTGPHDLMIFVNEQLICNGLTTTMYKLSKRNKDSLYDNYSLRITGNNKVFSVLNWLYEGKESISLQRKHNLYEEVKHYMENYKNEIGGFKNGKGEIIYAQ